VLPPEPPVVPPPPPLPPVAAPPPPPFPLAPPWGPGVLSLLHPIAPDPKAVADIIGRIIFQILMGPPGL
jgi:hypothetical protein